VSQSLSPQKPHQIASVRLTPDGKTVVYARGSEANKGGAAANPQSLTKTPKQQAWAQMSTVASRVCLAISAATRRTAKICRFRPQGRVSSGRQKRMAFHSNRKDHSFMAVLELATKKNGRLFPRQSADPMILIMARE